ncbi:hypothetical protein [Flavobacterium sp. Root420]|uniref:hypothetical protein n=1 Tax=Flavobacterium sp. Root420 TaxID=1736533 RepID=UPI0006F7A284|nr:hypothetical protein [Flavobacterium sp. Root420]KQW99464.1 hypothetical protein ASC72_10380 [Flavobacterium sp. Root420]
MKNILLCSILLCLLISCSTESDFNASKGNPDTLNKSTGVLPDPANKANPFDFKGKLYYDTLREYQGENQFPNSIDELNKQIRFIGSPFEKKSKTGKSILFFTDEIVHSIMDDPDNKMISIVENSELSDSAKISLIDFLQGLIIQRELDFSISYNYIVEYESTVIGNGSWQEEESETILTVASISRYSLYSEAEQKDRDWDKSSSNKPADLFFSTNEVSIISIIALLETIN